MSNDQRRIGFAASSHPRAVSIPEHFDFLRPTVPSKSFTTSNSSSLAFASSELLRFDSSLAPFGPSLTYPWVFGPLRDFTRAQPLLRDSSHRHRFVPSSGFLDLSTSFSALGLAGLFHPAATSRILSRSGASLPAQPPFLFGRSFPQAVASPSRSPTFAGCRSTWTSASRPSSARGRVRCSPVIHSPARRSPPRVPLLQASDFLRLDTAYPCPPLATFLRATFAFRDRGATSSSASLPIEARRRVSASPACSSFRAFPPTLRARSTNSPPVALR
jgi:hypothetical protein